MTALLTGATGFIGGRLAERILAQGRALRVLVRARDDAAALAAAGAEVVEGELGDPNRIAEAAQGCQVVFHCAGEASHHADPAALAWVHVAGTENVVNACRAAGVSALVYLSCADVTLENADRLYVPELSGATMRVFNAWARTKLLAEELALHADCTRLRVVALRPAWVWGPGDSTRLPMLLREAAEGGMALMGSGDNLVATAYVEHVVDALLAAEGAEAAAGLALHVADGEHVTISEFLGAMSHVLSLPAPRRGVFPFAYGTALLRRALGLEGAWPMEVLRRGRGRLLQVQSTAATLGYEPSVSMEEGMQALAQWVESRGGVAAVAALGRRPASRDVAHAHQRLADEIEAADSQC